MSQAKSCERLFQCERKKHVFRIIHIQFSRASFLYSGMVAMEQGLGAMTVSQLLGWPYEAEKNSFILT